MNSSKSLRFEPEVQQLLPLSCKTHSNTETAAGKCLTKKRTASRDRVQHLTDEHRGSLDI